MGLILRWMVSTTNDNNTQEQALSKEEALSPPAAKENSAAAASLVPTRILIGGTGLASLLVLLVATFSWKHLLQSAVPTQASVVATYLEYIDNDWWNKHYGSSYEIGTQEFHENFCVPYQYYATATLKWKCPNRVTSCQGSILAWDCGSRNVCREDCQALVDDGQDSYQCDDSNGDDDNNNNNDDGQQQTEEEMLECAQGVFSNATVNIVADCNTCDLALSQDDYEWVIDQEKYDVPSRWGGGTKNKVMVGTTMVLGALLGAAALFLYNKTNGGTKELQLFSIGDDDDDDDEEDGGDYDEFNDE